MSHVGQCHIKDAVSCRLCSAPKKWMLNGSFNENLRSEPNYKPTLSELVHTYTNYSSLFFYEGIYNTSAIAQVCMEKSYQQVVSLISPQKAHFGEKDDPGT